MEDLDALPCGILQTLDDGTIRRVNRTFCSWIAKAAEQLVGTRFQDLLTVGGRIFHHTHWAPLLRMQGSISEVKLELARDGDPLPIVINAIRREDGGTIVHEIAAYVARDRDRYEQELLIAQRRLQATVTELDALRGAAEDRARFVEQMIGIVSHDLRNPLSAIQMGTDLLATSSLSEPQQRILSRVGRSTVRAMGLIEDLLDFTRARLGAGIPVTLESIRLHEVVADYLDEHRLANPGRSITHERVGAEHCSGDPRRLVQALGNLVANALTYGAPDGPITVTTQVGHPCALSVHNLGPPIPSDLAARMFEPMIRGDGSDRRARGAGLGLFIVRSISRAHDGTASVRSSAETGTTFSIEWPGAERDPPTS